MGNVFCCTKKPDREIRSKLIIGSLGSEIPIGMNHYQVNEPTIYDDVYSLVDMDTKSTLV